MKDTFKLSPLTRRTRSSAVIVIFIVISLVFLAPRRAITHTNGERESDKSYTINSIVSEFYSIVSKTINRWPTTSVRFESVPGIFIQDNRKTDPKKFDVYHPGNSFGLIDKKSSDRWKRFKQRIQYLNEKTKSNSHVSYKVLYIARHGQGFHNVAESKYGTRMWNCYWSEKTGDGNLTWGPDAQLTSTGRHQVEIARQAWIREIKDGIPIPQLFVSSPLSRAIETMDITGIWNSSDHPPIVKEHWRENIGLHTCDLRQSKQAISHRFPFLEFEDGFEDEDNLWTEDLQETDKLLALRIRQSLVDLFLELNQKQLTYVMITAHSGVISALLSVIGHKPFPTKTAGMIPLVIKADFKGTKTYLPNPGPSAVKPKCAHHPKFLLQ